MILLTTHKGCPILINSSLIVKAERMTMGRNGVEVTDVYLRGREGTSETMVKETPEEIFAKIKTLLTES